MNEPSMEDSGERREFKSGAVRDRGGFKPRPDLISPHANLRAGAWLAKGAEKYGLRNYEKGMPISECIASLCRHIEDYKLGLTNEDHLAAIIVNAQFIAHYEEEIKAGRMNPAIDDMPKYAQRACPACGRGPVQPCQHPETGLEYTCSNCKWTSLDASPDPNVQYILDYSRLLPKSTPTFYITGPMRGYPFFNFPAFDGARDLGESLGHNIISPADLDREVGIDPINDPGCVERMKEENPNFLRDIVRRDIETILGLDPKNEDGLALLPGWQESIGASAEVAVARFKGLRLVDARDFKTPIEV